MAPQRRSALFSQVWTLAAKTIKIALFHQTRSTFYTAFLLPVLVALYLGVGQRLNQPQSDFGIAESRPVRSFSDALDSAASGRNTVLFVNGGFGDGAVKDVIDSLSEEVKSAGKNATTVESEDDIGYVCRSSVRGTSNCYGAVVFHSSPDQGSGGIWNYSIRADPALAREFNYKDDNNDAQIYILPFQRAIDNAIKKSNSSSSDSSDGLPRVNEYAYTELTEDEREDKQRRDYQKTFIDFLGVAFFVGLVGVAYHLPGILATERERGMSQLIDAMILTKYDWEPQLIRMLSFVLAFTIVYIFGWIACGAVAGAIIWKETNVIVPIIAFILGGIALTSMSLMGATCFKRAQLSGAVNSIIYLLFGVLAQALPNPGTPVVIILSILFTPSCFVFFIHSVARFEAEGNAANLLKSPPTANYNVPGIFFLIMFIIQALVYPIIAGFLERVIHGVSSEHRQVFHAGAGRTAPTNTLTIQGLTQIYRPSLFRRLFSFVSRPRPATVAVDNLNLTAKRGEILALLGANGSGKSTTLDAIAGISRFSQGNISIDATGGLGYAPQQNVIWDDLSVEENIRIFNRLKSPHNRATLTQNKDLAKAVGLESKYKSKAGKLSGGQKRKLQLALMLTGDSAVCCVDEVSSGIDPLSRRKIWDILLAERGSRTIILTTHFLDEADLLADHIAILSKGSLRAEGSSVELKDKQGAGYRIHVLDPHKVTSPPEIEGVERKITHSSIIYLASTSGLAANVVKVLEANGIEYRLSGPTIEDVFLQVAEEVKDEGDLRTGGEKARPARDAGKSHDLLTGRRIGFFQQVKVMFMKRLVVFKSNWIPYLIAFAIPIIAAGGTQVLIADEPPTGCSPREQSSATDLPDDFDEIFGNLQMVAGPRDEFSSGVQDTISDMLGSSEEVQASGGSGTDNLDLVTSLSGFDNYIEENRKNVTPGGIWLGDSNSEATFAYRADKYSVYTAMAIQNAMDMALGNLTIAANYGTFEAPFSSSTGEALQLAIYFGIAMSLFPAFFGLYPNHERRMNVRGLQYSSGARSFPLWVAHLAFDYAIVLVTMLIAAIIFYVSSEIWYEGAYLFPVFILYGLTSLLLSYVFSLFLSSQLGTYAACTAYSMIGHAIYFISFLYILTFSSEQKTDFNILAGHWVIAAFFPVASLVRAMFVALNAYSTSCSGFDLRSYPGAMAAYGGPILYLTVQAVLLFGVLLWYDSGREATLTESDQEIQNELTRVTDPKNRDGLRVQNLIKEFGDFTAVDNVTFGVEHSEVFALLGPNGAGKSTTISLIRGDIQPSKNGGDVFVEGIPVSTQRAAARANLGVCPQFDAIDNMTVVEHLRHYARIRGISDINHQVEAVIRAVGLEAFPNTMAGHLSGGNKRKLSLGIALTGNPSVILLDEPSSGLDAAAKRVMWRTLDSLIPGRSILLTTHSMEEADALASRAGIIAQRMLAVGSVDHLRQRFGDTLHVHLVSKTAPHSTPEEMEQMRLVISEILPGAEIQSDTYHGQMRFSVPASAVSAQPGGTGSAVGQLIVLLEDNKERLGISHHSVTPTTLNEVFLNIVGKHDVEEEGYSSRPKKKKNWWQTALWLMKP
ncbi:putative ABC transporter [Sarocladium strictum]